MDLNKIADQPTSLDAKMEGSLASSLLVNVKAEDSYRYGPSSLVAPPL